MHQFGWISERGGYLFKFTSERGGYQERGGGFPEKMGGSNPGGNYDTSYIWRNVRQFDKKTQGNSKSKNRG